jgi:hypothetical protein
VADHRKLVRLMREGDTRAALTELQRHLTAAQTSVREQVIERDQTAHG